MIHTSYNKMLEKANKIKSIRYLCNTIMANGCYHTKELTNQIAMAEKTGNITDDERAIIEEAWQYRHKLAHELIVELRGFIEYENQDKKED